MVLSTVNDEAKPESAVVGFGQTKSLELICGTSKLSKKAMNLLKNNKVSVVIGWDENGTLQYEGTARILSKNETGEYAQLYFDKNPMAKRFKDNHDEIYILISPKWVRFTESTTTPWKISELEF